MNIIKNSYWIIVEKSVTAFGLIFITSYVAKYIGPESYGKIILAASIFTIVQSFSLFGTESIVFKTACNKRVSCFKLMDSVKTLRIIIYVPMSLFVLTYFIIFSDYLTAIYCVATCIAFLFSTQDVIRTYNEATFNAKRNAVSNFFGLSIAFLLRYLIVYFKLNPEWLSLPIVLFSLIPYLIRLKTCRDDLNYFEISRRERLKYVRYAVKVGFPLMISGVSVAVYTKISHLILVYYNTKSDLGVYAAASTLATCWVFMPLALITSYFSIIYNERDSDSINLYMTKVNSQSFFLCVFSIIFMILTGRNSIELLFGNEYLSAYDSLIVLTISSSMSVMGVIANRFIIKNAGYRYLSIKALLTVVISIFATMLLVPAKGVLGAAYSVLITELSSLTILNYFFMNGEIGKMHLSMLKIKNKK